MAQCFYKIQHHSVVGTAVNAENCIGASIEFANSFINGTVKKLTTLEVDTKIAPFIRLVYIFAIERNIVLNVNSFAKIHQLPRRCLDSSILFVKI